MTVDVSTLPIRSALEIVARDVTYSNAMPDWYIARELDYSRRVAAVTQKLQDYANGRLPERPYEVSIPRPRPSGAHERWVMPCVNDLIVLQTCVSSLAPKLDKALDRKRVFSYRFNPDPNAVQLTEEQCKSSLEFDRATEKGVKSSGHVMFLDLVQAFRSVRQQEFLEFLRPFSDHGVEIGVLKALLQSFTNSTHGLPWVNDSLFFLGNAYFSVVDKIVSRHTNDFVRFVDDYSIFGASEKDLESLYKAINRDLQPTGFRINERKLAIVTSREYCEALAQVRGKLEGAIQKYKPVPREIKEPGPLIDALAKTIGQPDTFLNDGVGRLELGSLRKIHNSLMTEDWEEFASQLTGHSNVVRQGLRLLRSYASRTDELWRSVWLLYVLRDVHARSARKEPIGQEMDATTRAIRNSSKVPTVVRFWATAGPLIELDPNAAEELGDLHYEEVGRRLYGG